MSNETEFDWFPFNCDDWLTSAALQACSMGAQGAMINFLAHAYKAGDAGYMHRAGKRAMPKDAARIIRCDVALIDELVTEGVLLLAADGVYCPRAAIVIPEQRAKARANLIRSRLATRAKENRRRARLGLPLLEGDLEADLEGNRQGELQADLDLTSKITDRDKTETRQDRDSFEQCPEEVTNPHAGAREEPAAALVERGDFWKDPICRIYAKRIHREPDEADQKALLRALEINKPTDLIIAIQVAALADGPVRSTLRSIVGAKRSQALILKAAMDWKKTKPELDAWAKDQLDRAMRELGR